MNFSAEFVVGQVASVGVILVAGGLAMRVMVARIEERMEARETARLEALAEREKADALRHEETARRFTRLENALGITDGNGSGFVRRGEYNEAMQRLCERIAALADLVHQGIADGNEAVRVGHADREAIKERLGKVEVAIGGLRRSRE